VEVIAPVIAPDVGAAPPVTPPPVPPVVAIPVPPTTTEIPVPALPAALPAEAQPRLIVLRGLKRNVEYPLYEGHNFIGRADEKPVDIDLDDQEPPDRVWSSRQHALITFEGSKLNIEDLNSSNGTFVNRARIYPGQKRELAVNDIIQIGTVQMKLII
jgi:pSer/pThr/pTyr-binding forkhead associated (FHA) protein